MDHRHCQAYVFFCLDFRWLKGIRFLLDFFSWTNCMLVMSMWNLKQFVYIFVSSITQDFHSLYFWKDVTSWPHMFFLWPKTFQDLQLPGLLTKEQMQKELDSGKLPKLPPAKKWVRGLFWPATPRCAKSLDFYGWNGEKLHAGTPSSAAKNLFRRCAFRKTAWSKTQCVDSSLFPRGPKFFCWKELWWSEKIRIHGGKV